MTGMNGSPQSPLWVWMRRFFSPGRKASPCTVGYIPAALTLLRLRILCARAKVHFVNRLHAKIYWSKARGALLGSANLTANALGENGLQEAMVWLPPELFDIRPFIRSLHILDDFNKTLKWLHAAHIRFLQRNPFFFRNRLRNY
jgi:phosphatidylserine/phosphatidylglycerophosphate/cardiolipin synthase-like enzyme